MDMIAADEFLEWAEVYGNYYGTPEVKVREQLAQGKNVILEIDTQGALKVKAKFPQGIFIFIVPPSTSELEARIRKRGTETEEVIARRMGCAHEEMALMNKYNYVVLNDLVELAVAKIAAIITAEECKVGRNQDLIPKG
jgi:guanylate kinase